MRILRLDLEAVDEMEEAAEWYEQRQQGLARRFLDEIERLQETIVERPASYPRLDLPASDLVVRRALLSRFPYALVFLDREDEIRILAVAHTKRRPPAEYHPFRQRAGDVVPPSSAEPEPDVKKKRLSYFQPLGPMDFRSTLCEG